MCSLKNCSKSNDASNREIQHWSTKGKLWLINLTCQESMDVVYLDFSKVFNTASHSLVLDKLARYRLNGWTVIWVIDWQSMRFCTWDGSVCPGSSLAERDLGVLVNKVNMSQQACCCSNKGKSDHGLCLQGYYWRRDTLNTCQATPKLLPPVLVPPVQERCKLKKVQRRAKKVNEMLENLSDEERLKELHDFTL